METPSTTKSKVPGSLDVVGHSNQNRKGISTLVTQKLYIFYFRPQRSCLKISKLLGSACCWKAHTYPCISLSYYLVMGENDLSLEIYSAVKSTPLSGFIPLTEKTRIPLSTQFGVNWFIFHHNFFSELGIDLKLRPVEAFQIESKKVHLAKKNMCMEIYSNMQKCPHKWNDIMKGSEKLGVKRVGLGFAHKAASLQLSVLDLKPAFLL